MKTVLLAIFTFAALSLYSSCGGGNQGVNESGSADSDSMMNTDTLMVDTAGGVNTVDTTGNGNTVGDSGKVPVPTQ